MPEHSLQDRRILIVEDEYMLADELRTALSNAGANVAGMVGTVGDALDELDAQAPFDAAVLDVNLAGDSVFPVADRLAERRIPFVFTTGYDASAIPARFRGIVRFEKPVEMRRLLQVIEDVIDA